MGAPGPGPAAAPAPVGAAWRLRELCRRRLLKELVGRALERSGAAAPAGEGAAASRAYLALVADAEALQLVQAVCQLHELREARVDLVEQLEDPREALPGLDSLYLVAPSAASVERLARELSASGAAYAGLHIFFSHRLGEEELLRLAAAASPAIPRLRSFGELNLAFVPHDDRCFHLGGRGADALAAVLEGGPLAAAALADAANRLATLPMSLGVRPRVLFAARRPLGAPAGPCERLALELQRRVEEVGLRGAVWSEPAAPEEPRLAECTVLVVDRSFDWTPLLVHDVHYEALLYDVLEDGSTDVEGGKFRQVADDGAERWVPIGEERDPLWERCRHAPYWQVRDVMRREVSDYKHRDDEMRALRSSVGSPWDSTQSGRPDEETTAVSTQVQSTLAALQSLPDHKDRYRRLEVHTDICYRCVQAIQSSKIEELGAFEQDLATGVSASGSTRRLSNGDGAGGFGGRAAWAKAAERELLQWLQDPDLAGGVKARLLLLWLATPDGQACDEHRLAQLASLVPRDERGPVLNPLWRAAQRPESRDEAKARTAACKERLQRLARAGRGTVSSFDQLSLAGSRRLRRAEPRMRRLIEDAAAGAPEQHGLAECAGAHGRSVPAGARAGARGRPPGPAAGAQGKAVVVFVLGGVTLPEARAAHEAARASGVEAYVGGTALLTPGALLRALRAARLAGGAGGGAGAGAPRGAPAQGGLGL